MVNARLERKDAEDMKQPSREIIENARKIVFANGCRDIGCRACPQWFVNGERSCPLYPPIQFFKDFLAKYDTEETMFKVGDKVRIRDDIKVGLNINGIRLHSGGMAALKYQPLTIKRIWEGKYCSFKEDDRDFTFTLEILERIDTMDTEKEIAELKARIAKLEGKKTTYPCIKTDGETTVLFFGIDTGVIIGDDSGEFTIGNYSTDWDTEKFSETLTEYTIKV